MKHHQDNLQGTVKDFPMPVSVLTGIFDLSYFFTSPRDHPYEEHNFKKCNGIANACNIKDCKQDDEGDIRKASKNEYLTC